MFMSKMNWRYIILDCPTQFTQAEALYCNKDCGTNWFDNEYGCQLDDADAFCQLKNCNANVIAESFDILPAANQSGFACRGIGKNFGRAENPYHGIKDVHFSKDIKTAHGEGHVVTNIICKNRSSKSKIKIFCFIISLNR